MTSETLTLVAPRPAEPAATGPAPAPARPPRRVPPLALGAIVWSVFGALIAVRHAVVPRVAVLDTFGIIFTSIVVEALPFILLGAIVAAVLAVYVPERAFARFARAPRALQVPGAALAGVLFPVCECGSVPVGRRLMTRGMQPAAAVAFMIAAPLVNPLVVASTWVAYGGGARAAQMVAGRCALGLVVAVAVGVATTRGGALAPSVAAGAGLAGAHDHAHDPSAGRARDFAGHVVEDFLRMGRFLVLGAALSALLQTVLPQDALAQLAGNVVLAPLGLMALAFVLCLCSEADAFVAISFTAFPGAAQLAFLVMGPVADLKLATLYGATFGRRFTPRVLAVAVPLVLAGALLFGATT